ncbi:16S rRNA (cytidine(1402)-2'-O)-methyltransferase [Patescibacteria group bacterium]|nr:16S rRNA (cytidine(1402)-2'-O)-methyltransferase [Patescibacteria group bacterium]
MASLYIVATPIGNLEDISFRAVKTLKEVDLILAENTYTAKKLLNNYDIETDLWQYNQNSSEKQFINISEKLKEGKSLALISEAGTPGISDPGSMLVSRLLENLPDIQIIPITGASALSAIVSVSGLKMDRFYFLGFLPHKKGRQKILKEIKENKYSVVLYESKYRLLKLLDELIEHDLGDRNLVVGRELTKIYEHIYRGKADALKEYFLKNEIEQKGEFTIVIKKAA